MAPLAFLPFWKTGIKDGIGDDPNKVYVDMF